MVADQETTCLGLEYFCFEGDGLWTSSDDALVELARSELAQLAEGSDLAQSIATARPGYAFAVDEFEAGTVHGADAHDHDRVGAHRG